MFTPTAKQKEALTLLANPSADNVLLFGGSRSGKTLLYLYAMVVRALKEHGSRHVAVRNIHRDARQKIGMVSLPELHRMIGVAPVYDKGNAIFTYPGGSELWLCGLDDAGERDQRILGSEYSTMFFDECSEIPYTSIGTALTRLSQKNGLKKRAWYGCNPPSKIHWLHQLFVDGVDPVDRRPIKGNYLSLLMNPSDNLGNLDPGYMDRLNQLPERQRLRFRDGLWGQPVEGVLWQLAWIEDNRMATIIEDIEDTVVGVDPACGGSCSTGIVAVARGTSGHLYVLADNTSRGTPAEWALSTVTLAREVGASRVIAESNQGGQMVEAVLHNANPALKVELVHAGQSKQLRAEPVAALAERGCVHHVGIHVELEDQLLSWAPGQDSPDRLDALVHACAALLRTDAVTRPRVAGESRAGMEGVLENEELWTAL
jgi:phage terminase large subunit-like protein